MNRRIAVLLAASVCAACAPRPQRPFPIGVVGPVGPRTQSAAAWLGLAVMAPPPEGATVESADRSDHQIADSGRLRLAAALAAVRGRAGVFFILPTPPAGRELVDYPEEWQSLARVAQELVELRPILEGGDLESVAAPGLEARAWRYRGRRYVLLVNAGAQPAGAPEGLLDGTRALFEARADARDVLQVCPAGYCLGAGRVLWLEGRQEGAP
jgi:hypothetical protein